MRNLQVYYYLNTNLLVITNARANKSGGAVLNAATGTAQLQDKAGVAIVNGGPIALVYILGSQGRYECVFPANVVIVPNQFVRVEILMDGGPSLQYRGLVEAIVKEAA